MVKIYTVPIETLGMLVERMEQEFKKDQNTDNQKLISGYIQGLQAAISVLEQEQEFIYAETPLEHIDETLESFREFIQDDENGGTLDPEDFIGILKECIIKISQEHDIDE